MMNSDPPKDDDLGRNSSERKDSKKKKKKNKSSSKKAGDLSSPRAGESPFSPDSETADDQLEAMRRRSSNQADGGINAQNAPNRTGASSAEATAERLNRAEQDALIKAQAGSSRSATGVARASAYSMEQEARATGSSSAAAASGGGGAAARRAAAAKASGASRGNVLNQMEQDIISKDQARSSAFAATSAGAQSYQGGSQVDERKQRSQPRSSLQNLEANVVAKTRSFESQQPRSSQASRASSSSDADPDAELAAAKEQAKNYTTRVQSTARSTLISVEEDMLAKQAANASSAPNAAAASWGVAEDRATSDPFAIFDEDDKLKAAENAIASEMSPSQLHPPSDDGIAMGQDMDDTFGHPEADDLMTSARPEAALGAGYGTSTDVELAGTNAHEVTAFVPNPVVDATGVAVVMSEAEEEILERKRHRRYCMFGVLAFLVIAAGIVATVILTLSPDPPAPLEPTTMPSVAPSMVPSAAPTTERLDAWIQFLMPMVSEGAFDNVTSPQYLAAMWLADEDKVQTEIGSDRGVQRFVLATFYYALDGDNWEQCGVLDPTCGGDPDERSWLLEDENECDWLGVDCDITKTTVNGIFFQRQLGNGLSGYLPPELTLLPELRSLILQRNNLIGTIPSFLGNCTNLQALFLLGNKFEGTIPDELLMGATMLGTLHVEANFLSGTIPTYITELPLRLLNLATNNMNGTLPSEIGQMTLLTSLELQKNNFTGTIPEALYDASALERCRLSDNKFEGTLSTRLGLLTNLQDFRLGYSQIGGTIPPSFYTMPNIVDFRVEEARISGTLSNSIAAINETLRRLYLNNNQMTGPLPIAGIQMLSNMNELILHGNAFTGTITDAICALKGSRFFDLTNLTVPTSVDCSVVSDPFCCTLQA